MRLRYSISFIFIFGLALNQTLSAASQTDTLTVAPGDTAIYLTKSLIYPASLLLRKSDGTRIPHDSLQIDALQSIIRYDFENSDTLVVIASYEYIDLKLPRQQILNPPPRPYVPSSSESQEKKLSGATGSQPVREVDYDFLKSGTLYRGISLRSNSGMSLQSGLNLELEGNISDDIAIVGSLSDQNIPIQPEGNTQTIEEIDKVFIRVRMPHEAITFGDYEFTGHSGALSNYERKLQGVLIESNRNHNQIRVSGAVTKGQYTSNYFQGEESNQGPYQLTGKEGETAIIVLAGTEKVWINGELMKRGENNDYVIDYGTGEISFTPHRLITSDSRISVDFQYSNLVYQKNIWIANNSTALAGGKLKLSAGLISETDDKDHPIELTLQKEDRLHLKSIGDRSDEAFQSTIVEDSAGVYSFKTVDSILVYVGTGGTHSASFYNVGEKGSYRKVYTATGCYFEYVDKTDPSISLSAKEEAVYLPVKPLKLPTSQQLYHFAGEWQASRYVSIRSELAGSDFDRNSFSPLNDGDNRGLAFNVNTEIGIPLSSKSRLSANLKYRQIGDRFEPIDRMQEVEYRRRWDLPSDSTQGERVFESDLKIDLSKIAKLSLDLGSYDRNSINANRYKIGGTLHYRRVDNAEIYQEQIHRDFSGLSSDWLRQKMSIRLKGKYLKPFGELYREVRNDNSEASGNFRFIEQRFGFDIFGSERLTGRFESYHRDDDEKDSDVWIRAGSSQNYVVSGQINNWKTFSSRFSYTYRIKEYYQDDATPNQEVQLMDVILKQQPRKLPYSWESNMKIEEERTVMKEYQYFYVGEGEGQYIYDSTYADYVSHPNGDYILRIVPSEIREPVTSIRNGLRVQFNGRRLRNKIPWEIPTRITTLTDIRLQQQIRSEDNPLGIMTMDDANIDDRWAYFNRIFQQDMLYYFKNRRSNLRLRYLDNITVSQLDVRGAEHSAKRAGSLRYRGSFVGKLNLESEFVSEYTFRESAFNNLRNRDIRSYRLDNTFSYAWDIVHLYECELKSSYDKNRGVNGIKSFLIGIRNNYERKVQNKGRWKTFIEFDRVAVTPKGSPIPWEMSSGKKEGTTFGWGVSAEYRIGKNLSMRLNYEGWNEPERDVYHLGGGEIRALF
ncbi:MAG: hypothetical protein DRP96_00515 [Candidatus Neomarinimicrobiota bacterium]|nr:MAG: hypothetical protein DRP96_00515 [Candidatus Neomarinimicrobiota bacterium]